MSGRCFRCGAGVPPASVKSRRDACTTTKQGIHAIRYDPFHNRVTEERRMNFYVGTSGYSYPEWKGTFYPTKMPPKQMLGFYGERFRTVEINNTFYRPPTEPLLLSWAAQVPANF